MREVTKQPKIKVDHQMDDFILLESASQVTNFKRNYRADKIFILRGDQCICSSDGGHSYNDLRCELEGIKGNHMFD